MRVDQTDDILSDDMALIIKFRLGMLVVLSIN